MDEIDQKLIRLLRHNARASISDLAVKLNVTRATTRARLEKLVKQGVILGFTVIVKADLDDQAVRAMMLIAIEGTGIERAMAELNGLPEVKTIHVTNGRWDLILEVGTDTLVQLDEILRKIRYIDGITQSETNIYLATRRNAGQRIRMA
jgi:DNA-binding Lrp family transcriptional regulator